MAEGDRLAFCREVLEFEPHAGQRRWYENATRPENALVMGNRGGKSMGEAALKIYECARRDGWTSNMIARYDAAHEPYHAINVAMTASQAALVWIKARAMLMKPTAQWLVSDVKMTPFPRIEFRNGAIFEARPTARRGEYLLGNVYDRASWDEAAWEQHFEYIRDNILKMRMVDRSGRIDYITTGNGRNEFGQYFLRGLAGGDPDFYCQSGTTYDNPHISHAALDKAAARMSDRKRRQNIGGEIVDAGDAFFPYDDVRECTDSDLDIRVLTWDAEDREAHAIVFIDEREWVARYPTHRYVSGWDLAEASDWTVGTTWDITTRPHVMVEFERFNKTGWAHVYDRIRVRDQKYAYNESWIDATGLGAPVLETLSDIGAKGVIFTDNVKGTGKKSEMLNVCQSQLSLREVRFPYIRAFLEEVQFYTRPDKGLVKDSVMSWAVSSEGMRAGGGEAYASEI